MSLCLTLKLALLSAVVGAGILSVLIAHRRKILNP